MTVMIRNLSKTYANGTVALANCSMTIEKGMFGLLGPNGAGKTTMLRIMATLLSPTLGEVEICGLDSHQHRSQIRKMIGYLPQEFGLYPSLAVEEYLDYMGLLTGMGKQERRQAVDRALHLVNLDGNKKTRCRALSGGMKRRLGIAQAVLHSPRVLMVDEPTAGLDPEERLRFRNLLVDLAQDRVVILSTHIVEDIATTCPRVAVLHQGKILKAGSPHDLLSQAEGAVWLVDISENRLAELRRTYNVVAVTHTAQGVQAKIIHEGRPAVKCISAHPSLEDAYMVLMGGGKA